jgi:hypothetical protein
MNFITKLAIVIAIVAIAALVVMTNIKAVEQEAQEIIGAIETNT